MKSDIDTNSTNKMMSITGMRFEGEIKVDRTITCRVGESLLDFKSSSGVLAWRIP